MPKSPLLAIAAWCSLAVLGGLPAGAPQTALGQAPPAGTPPAATPPRPRPAVKSPEVQADGTVVFRVYAPKANEVVLRAEGLEAAPETTREQMMGAMIRGLTMAKGEDGVWSITFGPIPPGVYRYSFAVDGVASTDPVNPVSSETLNGVKSVYEVPGASFLEYRPEVPHGAIAIVWYQSPVLGTLRRMHVYTPPGYEVGAKRYPVMYLLHGSGDSDDSWTSVGRAGAILDNLIAEHKAEPMIVVMPMGHISRAPDPNGPANMGHDKFSPDLTDVVVPFVDRQYRTLADRAHRALAGLSMGGGQALVVSLTRSDLFASIGIFSSGFFPAAMDNEEQTDFAQYKREGKPFQLYWMDSGAKDQARPQLVATVPLLKKYGIDPEVHESDGFHAWNNWRDYLTLFAPRLFHGAVTRPPAPVKH